MKKIIFILVLVGLIAGGGGLLWRLPIRQVSCFLEDHQLSIEDGVCAQLQNLIGSRLLFRDFYRDAQVAEQLYLIATKETFEIVRSEKSLAGPVKFFLLAQPPLYRLQSAEETVLVTKAGSFRENNQLITAPLVLNPLAQYQKYPGFHVFLTEFLDALGERKNLLTEIELISPTRVEAKIPGLPIVLLAIDQDPQQAAIRLAVILEKLNPQEIDLAIRELDLRFDLPVLRTTESSEAGQALIDSQE